MKHSKVVPHYYFLLYGDGDGNRGGDGRGDGDVKRGGWR